MKVGIYLRVSTQRQADKWSLSAQQDILTKYATDQGWKFEVFNEGGVSAETVEARPVMQRLLDDITRGKIQGVLVIEIERLCRAQDLTDWALITTTIAMHPRQFAAKSLPGRDLVWAEPSFDQGTDHERKFVGEFGQNIDAITPSEHSSKAVRICQHLDWI